MQRSVFKTMKKYIALLLLPVIILLSGCIDFSLLKYPKVKATDDGFIYKGAEYVFYTKELQERGYAVTGDWDTVARGVRGHHVGKPYPISANTKDPEKNILIAGDGYDGIQPAWCLKKGVELPASVLDCTASAFVFLAKNYRDPIGEVRDENFPLCLKNWLGEKITETNGYFRDKAYFCLELLDHKNYLTSGVIVVAEYMEELYLKMFLETTVYYEIKDEYQAKFREMIEELERT